MGKWWQMKNSETKEAALKRFEEKITLRRERTSSALLWNGAGNMKQGKIRPPAPLRSGYQPVGGLRTGRVFADHL